jgi:nitrate/nitrite transport system ATP-binding protein
VAFLEAQGVTKSFPIPTGTRHVLRDVNLSVDQGQFVCIVGAMGSGKSTLLSLLAGLTMPDAGTITIGGEPVRGIRPDAAFVFQNYSLLPWFSALENVRLAVQATFPQLTREQQKDKARQTLELVGLGNATGRRPKQLSGGMRQRVALARGLATDPKVLFLDDPFGALDALTRETLQQELVRISADTSRGATTVMITNNVEEALLLADTIVPVLAGPPATLGAPITVELPRPRTVAQLAHDEDADHVRGHVIATLTAALGRRKSGDTAAPAAPVLRAAVAEEIR